MKLIQSAFAISMLLTITALAQSGPPSPSGATVVTPTQSAPPPGMNRPMPSRPNFPPGMSRMGGPQRMAPPTEMPPKDKVSTAIGLLWGNKLRHDHVDVDMDALTSALKTAVNGGPPAMTDAEMGSVLRQLTSALQYRAQQDAEKEATTNKVAGDEFLAKHANEDGVKKLANGIEYKVLKEGSGPNPKTTDTVTVGYKGSLIDGTEFDHNDSFKTPVTGRTIRGWSEVLPLMTVGSKWEVAIPPDLAYGRRAMSKIPPESVLVFDIELLSINPASASAQRMPPGAPLAAQTHSTSTTVNTPVVSGQIIKVPSADELKHGAKIEVITNAPSQ